MTARRRLLALPAAALVCLVLVAGCSDDDGGDDSGTPTTAPSTTAAGSGSSSSTGSTETTEGDDTSTSEGDTTVPDTSKEGDEGTGAPTEEAADVDWGLNAVEYRGRDGERIAFDCPSGGSPDDSVWGDGTYTDDSSVCAAAVHAGLITPEEGGRVVIEIAPGETSYTGSDANGVTSQDYGEWGGSFTFPTA